MEGWIKLNRQIRENFLWEEKPFDKKSAWIDLLLTANYKENKFMLGTELITVPAGSFVTSELKLMNRWGWSKTKVRSFLKLLESENMIVKKTDKKKTTLTIVNYEVYQGLENHEKTTKKPQKDTNKKEKKEKKDNIYIELTFIDDVITNVNLTELQYSKLKDKYGIKLLHDKIEALNLWVTSNTVKDHYLTLNNWCRKEKGSEQAKGFEKRNAPRPNFD